MFENGGVAEDTIRRHIKITGGMICAEYADTSVKKILRWSS